MIVVRIELWSGRTGQRRELGCAIIANDASGSAKRGNYVIRLHKTLSDAVLRKPPWRSGSMTGFPRRSLKAWDLLLRGLLACVYDRNKTYVREGDAAKGLPGFEGVYAPDPGGKQRVARDTGP